MTGSGSAARFRATAKWRRSTGAAGASSAWSPSKDYSLDAHVSDALAVMGAMQWQQAIVIGHSASGRTSMSLAANFPDKVARLIVLDSPLGGEIGTPRGPTVGNPPLMFGSIEAAMASFEKLSSPPRIGHDHERAPHALIRTEHGFMLKRDPDNGNSRPVGADAGVPRRPNRDVWQDLAAVRAPTLYVRAVRSDRLTDAMIERLTREHPKDAGDGRLAPRHRRSGAGGAAGSGAQVRPDRVNGPDTRRGRLR